MSFLPQVFQAFGRSLAAAGALFFMFSGQAHAVDGCKVLLCVAGNWKDISQCRPDVEKAMSDVAKGKGWPTCDQANGAGALLQPTTEATCPAMYAVQGSIGGDSGTYGYVGCKYAYVINVVGVAGQPWSDLFWNMDATTTSTRYYPPARTALGNLIDPTYDNDASAYVPPPASPTPSCSGDNC